MSSNGDSRAARARAIRETLDESQRAFARRLTAAAEQLGLGIGYVENDVSKRENEYKQLSLEDVAVYETVDPLRRGWFWIAFGRRRPGAQPGRGDDYEPPETGREDKKRRRG